MTNKKVMSVFAIVAVAAIMGGSAVTPAFAAQKVIDIHDHNTFGPFFWGNICGEDNVYYSAQVNTFYKVWDNDKFKYHSNWSYTFVDADNDQVVATADIVTNNQGDFNDLPISYQDNFTWECIDGTVLGESSFGYTIHKDGSITYHS